MTLGKKLLIPTFGRGASLTICTAFAAVQICAQSYFGYAPLDPAPEHTAAQGSGRNGYTEAAITLDAASNPVVGELKGAKILGVRCFMRADYPQKSKRTSAINIRTGSLDADPVKNYANFFAGWNEIMLDEPVVIGDEPIFIGPMVYETSGNPYPFVSATGPSIPGGYSVSLNKEAWQTLTTRGNLLMQLILDRDPADMPVAAMVGLDKLPPVVAPDNEFVCDMAIHNFSGSPVRSVTVTNMADNGTLSFAGTLTFDPAIGPFDSRTVTGSIHTGRETDPAVAYSVSVTAVNGAEVVSSPATDFTLYVTDEAFLRIPLIEEFTSMKCTNCPFMAYYLDMAMEDFGRPHVYISRHVGFAKDKFTYPGEDNLTYLFGMGGTYNPAVMYDRTIRSESDATPVYAAQLPSVTPYSEAIDEAAKRPAQAKLIVDSEISGGKVSCVVKGQIARGVSLDGLYICASLIENNIRAEGNYEQSGIADAADDAPADLAEKFRHNGVVRVAFNSNVMGMPLKVDAETREFTVDFGTADLGKDWNPDNCEVVAFINRYNPDDLSDNYILNAGGTRWNKDVENSAGSSSVTDIVASSADVKVTIDAEGRIAVIGHEGARLTVHTVDGRQLSANRPLSPGVYIIGVTLPDGSHTVRKLRR